jgi:hypothetical protein
MPRVTWLVRTGAGYSTKDEYRAREQKRPGKPGLYLTREGVAVNAFL